jgi:hypothetical protein
VQAEFEQHAGGDFGKGGVPSAAFGLARAGLVLRRVGQAELRAIQSHQPPAAPESIGLFFSIREGLERQAHEFREDLPRQARAPVTPRTLGERAAKEQQGVLAECAGEIHKVEDQCGE